MADDYTINGQVFPADEVTIDGALKKVPREKITWGAPGTANDTSDSFPLPVREPGTFAYAAGTAAFTIDVPSAARLKRVSVVAGPAGATITIGGGATITVPASGGFDEQIPGSAIGADVVLTGDVSSYYVAWTT